MASITFSVNDVPHESAAEPDTPLLYILRDELGLNSPRYGCGREQCGACRVAVDGKLEYSCTLPLEAAAGKAVATVEGLGGDHPLQRAFLELNAGQCAYCSTGILMAAWHLLQENPSPNRQEIAAALDPHLCRCGAHNRFIKAIERAASGDGS